MTGKWRALFDASAVAASFVVAACLVAGFFGDVAPFLDSFAHFRAHAAAVLGLLALVLALRGFIAAAVSTALTAGLALFTVYPFLVAPSRAVEERPVAPRYTLLQMNLRFDAPDKAQTLRLIGSLMPDVVTVQELTGEWRRLFEGIADRYPHQFYCAPSERAGDAAILSRRPFAPGGSNVCDPYAGFAAQTVDFNGTGLVIGSEHLRWPWPGRQWRQIERLTPVLQTLGTPRLIAGDFNAAPWSAALRRYARESGTAVVPGIGPTWMTRRLPAGLIRYVGLPIDQVLVSEDVVVLDVARADPTSSDHLPLVVTFTLPVDPTRPEAETVARSNIR